MYNRLVEFAKTNEIFILHQFGFRKNHSTLHALIHLVNKISSAIDQHENTAVIFLDLSKAFDTLDHEILFTKLEHYGIRDAGLRWIKSYFFIAINHTSSPMQTIKCGVPQGSIPGPLFLQLYIIDLPKYFSFCPLLTTLVFFILIPTQIS